MDGLNVTKDVITDLLPAYDSGEASEDTRRLVDAFLADDPGFARLVARLRQVRVNGDTVNPSPDTELRSLKRTKHLMSQRTSVLAVAIFFSLAPFLFTFQDGRITWLLIRDAPIVGGAYLLTALSLWVAYLIIRRKLKVL